MRYLLETATGHKHLVTFMQQGNFEPEVRRDEKPRGSLGKAEGWGRAHPGSPPPDRMEPRNLLPWALTPFFPTLTPLPPSSRSAR